MIVGSGVKWCYDKLIGCYVGSVNDEKFVLVLGFDDEKFRDSWNVVDNVDD